MKTEMKEYTQPEVDLVEIDNEISLMMSSLEPPYDPEP